MENTQTASLTKERIISFIKTKGPSLPVHISKSINMNNLFTSAFLSELYNEGRVKMSNMKVGSSSIYYILGQEPQLDGFIEFLNQKEREAYHILKENRILSDEEQEPAIRVALRSIKDFAFQFKIPGNNDKIFWRYYLLPEREAIETISPRKEEKKPEPVVMKPKEEPVQQILKEETSVKKEIIAKEEKVIAPKPEKKKKIKQEDVKFANNVKEYLAARDVEVLESLLEKKKEFNAKIRIDTMFGKQEYLLFAREKKKVTEEELIVALQKAQSEKMPALIMIPGDIDKKAQDFFKNWKNLIKFEKLKL